MKLSSRKAKERESLSFNLANFGSRKQAESGVRLESFSFRFRLLWVGILNFKAKNKTFFSLTNTNTEPNFFLFLNLLTGRLSRFSIALSRPHSQSRSDSPRDRRPVDYYESDASSVCEEKRIGISYLYLRADTKQQHFAGNCCCCCLVSMELNDAFYLVVLVIGHCVCTDSVFACNDQSKLDWREKDKPTAIN